MNPYLHQFDATPHFPQHSIYIPCNMQNILLNILHISVLIPNQIKYVHEERDICKLKPQSNIQKDT